MILQKQGTVIYKAVTSTPISRIFSVSFIPMLIKAMVEA